MTDLIERSEDLDDLPRGSALRRVIRDTLGDEWLSARNVWLANRRPEQLIGSDDEGLVRDLYRSILVSAVS